MPRPTHAGAMDFKMVEVADKLTQFQHEMGLYGSVGEIGVHMGLYFLAMAINVASTVSTQGNQMLRQRAWLAVPLKWAWVC